MRPSVFLFLLDLGYTLAASSPSSHSSHIPSSLGLSSSRPSPVSHASSLSFSHPRYPASVPTPRVARSSSFGTGSSSTPLSNPHSSSTSHSSILTHSLPSGISISSSPFLPFPLPSSEPPIPGVYPLASPNNPPPVGTPALVPDFGPAWTNAYEKSRAKVSDLISQTVLPWNILSRT